MHDWAEVHRLRRKGESKKGIARRLGMSRTTVIKLLDLREPPRYERRPMPSKLDPYKAEVLRILDDDAEVAATVILEHLRRSGYAGGITILRDYVRSVRPQFVAAQAFQRTSYLPGEISQLDWWKTGVRVPVGRGARRDAFGLVATLPYSAAHACVFTLEKTAAAFCQAAVGCYARLGGVAEKAVVDNDTSIVAQGTGAAARLHDEVAEVFGRLGVTPAPLGAACPTSKGQVERTVGYLEGSFLPLRRFEDLGDLQAQHDAWAAEVAYPRHHRRVGAVVADAYAAERDYLRRLPDPLPAPARHLEVRCTRDAFVRVAGGDYSVPPGLVGRRLGVRLTLEEVRVHCEGREVARHRRSWAPADVVLDPRHARELREHREARGRLAAARADDELPAVDLARYDEALGVGR